MKENSAVKKAVLIGSMCAISYLSVYLARNVLGAVAPQMEELKVIDKTLSGNLSSLFFVAYAIGQLINGLLGDKIKLNI